MNAAELTAVVLAQLKDLFGENYHRACGAAARIAESYGAQRRAGYLVDAIGQRHMHHWAVLDGEVVDPLAGEYDGPVQYETLDEDAELHWRGQRIYREADLKNIEFPFPPEPDCAEGR